MDDIKIGQGENPGNDNGLGADHCSCGAKENGGPHNLKCVMEQEGLRTVTVNFGPLHSISTNKRTPG